MPRRRGVLKKTALTTASILALGCIKLPREGDPAKPAEDRDRPCWKNVEDERIDKEPFFDPEREDEMVLREDDTRLMYDEYEDEEHPKYYGFIKREDYSNVVLIRVHVHHTVDGAETHYDENKERYDDPDTFTGFADQAVRQDSGDHAEMTIRVSNAIGHIISYTPEEAPEDPDDRTASPGGRAHVFGEELHNYWAGTSRFQNEPGFCREEVKDLQQPDQDN